MNINILYNFIIKQTGCINLIVPRDYSNIRIDKYLCYIFKSIISRNQIRKFFLGHVYVNKLLILNLKIIIKKNDLIKIITPIKIIKYNFKNNIIIAEKINLNIVHEDEYIIIINKPPGMVVEPGYNHLSGTLLHGLKYYFNYKNILIDNSNDLEFKNRIGLVNRIDKNTSGLILIAKNSFSYQFLKHQFIIRKVKKKYITLVWGCLKNKYGIINTNIIRDYKNRCKMKVWNKNTFYGKNAITKYRVLEIINHFSLIECDLYTGRTHQIRVHFQYLGHPVFNDSLYGGNKILIYNNNLLKNFVTKCFIFLGKNKHALHSTYLEFIHPNHNNSMIFKSDLPKYFILLLENIKKFYHKFN